MKAIKTQPLKWHGGKSYLADWIISLMPPRAKKPNAPDADDPGWLHYVEPYFGGGAVLLAQNPEGISEVANDKNKSLANFWKVMQNDEYFAPFSRVLLGVPFSKLEHLYADHWDTNDTPRLNMPRIVGSDEVVGKAVNFFIRCRQSMSGRMDSFAPLSRNRTRSGMNEQASAWINAVDGLPEVHARLRRVVILNDDAVKVIKQQDGPRTLFYCDPPYLHETRSTTGEYEHEMTETQHFDLLKCLANIKGKFMLSGYHSAMYDGDAERFGWKCHERAIDNKASSAKSKERKIECVWTNY